METLKSGTVLQNKYQVERVLGSGGMGAVYLAYADNLKKNWALKEMIDLFSDKAERERALAQFGAEATILANLHHPNLPRVVDFFEESGRHYLVMDYIEGRTLRQILEEKSPGASRAVEWAITIAETLHFLHSQNPPIIFRDLTPSNVMITADGGLRLIDFGISKLFTPMEATREGARGRGTPGFCAPEQYGTAGTDGRTDIYSLGALLYNLLTGVTPPDAVLRLSQNTSLGYDNLLDGALMKIISKALSLNKEARFQNALEMRDALIDYQSAGRDAGQSGKKSAEKSEDLTVSLERVRDAFKTIFVDNCRWKEEPPSSFDCGFSQGILEKNILYIKLFPALDESAMLGFVDMAVTLQKQLSRSILSPVAKFYFLCLSPEIAPLDEVLRIAEAATVHSLNVRLRFIIPVSLNEGECYDRYIPDSHKDSNDLKNVFLNIRIAVHKI
jgi:serine/threonine protein kinase